MKGQERERDKHASAAWWGCSPQEKDSPALRKLLQMANNPRLNTQSLFDMCWFIFELLQRDQAQKQHCCPFILQSTQNMQERCQRCGRNHHCCDSRQGSLESSQSGGYLTKPEDYIRVIGKVLSIRRKQWEKLYFISDLAKLQIQNHF